MPDQMNERLELLADGNNNHLLQGIKRGMEKESLRVTPEGKLAQTSHPKGLGSALTNGYITTDFSEALLELITPVSTSIDETINTLDQIHRFTYQQLDNEKLWTASMPCLVESDNCIPVAQYGSSNVAMMKTAYRKGLGNRYGRLMQTIAGIHYNFSLPEDLWAKLQQQDYDKRSLQDYITDSYFKLIRNFRRYSWLLVYLYGASPAVCKCFVQNHDHDLSDFDDFTAYQPFGTALRMGDLGYQSSAQENLKVCYNTIESYIDTLKQAITNIHPGYDDIGIKEDGEYLQLSSALLQIENEFYSPIRPKRVTESGEIPLGALQQRGVEYIEVRCIDVNPYLPLGIDADQIRFLDCFILFCLCKVSPICDDPERDRISSNLKNIVNQGRRPGLQLAKKDGPVNMSDWGNELMDEIDEIAKLLDQAHDCNDYQRVCKQQRDKLSDSSLTPSAKILDDMTRQQQSFFSFAMNLSSQHEDTFKQRPLDAKDQAFFDGQASQSFKKQADIEASDSISFDQYLAQYYRQYDQL